jgi:hypothetical protein
MNQTGTLDSGTAGVVRAQLESQMNKDLAGLFGQAKQVQRDDYFNSLDQLRSLYPERFEVRNIPNYLNYMNATNSYNVGVQRNAATEADRLQRLGSTNQAMANLFGAGGDIIGGLLGIGGGGGGAGNGFTSNLYGSLANAGLSQYGGNVGNQTSGGGNLLSSFMNLFGGNRQPTQQRQAVNPYAQASYSQAPLSYASTGGNMFNPYGGYSPQQSSSLNTQSTPEMGGGMNFSKLLKMFTSGGVGAGASMFA